MTRHRSKTVAVSDQLLSLSPSITIQPSAGTDHSAPTDECMGTSETTEPDVIPSVTASSGQGDAFMGRSLGQILIVLVVFLVLVNI